MTLAQEINNLQTPAKELLSALYVEMAEMIFIPNSLLPEKYHGRETVNEGVIKAGRSAASVLKKSTPVPSEVVEDKDRAKAIRMQSYRDDFEKQQELEFIENDNRLYRQQVTFAKILGLFD